METRMPPGSLNVVNVAEVPSASDEATKEHILQNEQSAPIDPSHGLGNETCALDSAYLAAQTFGDIELEVELLELFVTQARRLVPTLENENGRERADKAHLLKGSARAIGANLLAASVERLETVDDGLHRPDQAVYDLVADAFSKTEAAISIRLSVLQA